MDVLALTFGCDKLRSMQFYSWNQVTNHSWPNAARVAIAATHLHEVSDVHRVLEWDTPLVAD